MKDSDPNKVSDEETYAFPTSYAQHRLWFLQRLEPDNPAYNVLAAFRLTGPVHVAALEKSFQEIVRRHEVLRTTFALIDGEPKQIVAPIAPVQMELVNIRTLPEAERENELLRSIAHETKQPFDLDKGALLRVSLMEVDEDEHVLLINMHHIVSDGWSMGVLHGELSELYRAFTQGRSSPLGELPIQYADYAIWQREWLRGEELERQLSYWKKQLEGAPALLNFPTDRARPAVQSFRGASQSITLSKEVSEQLKGLSRKEGVTLFMTLLAAFQTLLYRYTGQEDIVVGSPIANRTRSEIEGLIGFFVNTLVLRGRFGGDPTFRELLAETRRVALDAYEHQDLPFEKLVEELKPERSLSYSPVFQVMFVLQNAPERALSFEGVSVSRVRTGSDTAKFDLTLSVQETEQGLTGSLQYNTDLLEAATVTRLLKHFETLLRGIVDDPKQRISDLPILTEAEERQVLIDWSGVRDGKSSFSDVVRMFEQQAERTPDALALAFEDISFSYDELNRRANQLAHYLMKQGVRPESHVAMCLERSVESVIGLLAVLKAGGVYVPLDPSYPRDRLIQMMRDLKPLLFMTTQAQMSQFALLGVTIIALNAAQESIAQEGQANPQSANALESAAYLLYTSGSTGEPKGVVLSRGALGNLISWQIENLTEPSAARTLQFAPCGFDVSIQEVLTTWCSGGSLFLLTEEVRRDGQQLLEFLKKRSIERVFLPFVALQNLAEAAAYSDCYPLSLREIITAGEQLQMTPLLRSFLSRLGDCCLRNQYGPTESHVATEFVLKPPFVDAADLPPIGRPIGNTFICILDGNLQPVPIGVTGEICIGGAGLARGYLNQPKLTAEKFFDWWFLGRPVARLYKTGDRGRYLPDGNIEFLGRLDHQVKIRGFRVELGEIEAVLGQIPSVHQVVVVACSDSPTDKRLVAYVVAAPGFNPTAGELRAEIQQKLPEYMVPAFFIFLQALPVNRNGKLDRRALPEPHQKRRTTEGTYVAARTTVEERLCAIFRAVLRTDNVGIDDNFFTLGGHSLLATQVIARIRSHLAVELPLRRLFESPTVAKLAAAFADERRSNRTIQLPPIQAKPRPRNLPLSFAQQRLWFIDQLEPGSPTYNVPGVWRLNGALDLVALEKGIQEIVRRHEVLRTVFVTVDGKPIQQILPSLPVSLDLITFETFSETERESAIQYEVKREFQTAFDLAQGPLLRAKLFKLAKDDHVLLLTMHHIVSDGWSVGVLFHELSALYEAFVGGDTSILADLPIQYADYALWQRGWLHGEILETQLAYWRKQLDGLAVSHLPTDRARPAIRRYCGSQARVHLDALLTSQLSSLSRAENSTLYITLLAAFQILLGRYCDQNDIAVGSPIAGRSIPELEKLIGFFANTLVLRGDLSGEPTFREFLKKTREVALDAYEHQDVPFEKLVEELHPRRELNISPLFQVMLVLQNEPGESLALTGLTVSPMRVDNETAKFDLLLSLREGQPGLTGTLEYDTDLFDAATAKRLVNQFETLLRGIVDDPNQKIRQLPLMTAAERHRLLVEWNETEEPYSHDLCVHQLFERQAEKCPDRIALVFETESMTYRDLDTRSNQLAHYLKKQGVGPESVVAVCMERSPAMIVAVIAVLKAGGAYLPLDPSYPSERLGFLIEQSEATILLTLSSLVSGLRPGKAACHCLDEITHFLSQEKAESLQCVSMPQNAAYVLFTSGSTGVPKGVLMEHRSLVNLLSWQVGAFTSPVDARTLQFAPLSFDVSFQEIFSTLCFGGTLVMIGELERRDPRALLNLLNEKTIERMFLPPVALQQLAEAAVEDDAALEDLKEVITAGEQLYATRPIRELFSRFRNCRLHNQYGPTESHVVSSFSMASDPADWPNPPPIGRPIANTQIYILGPLLQPVPIGVVGEIYIGGDGVSRGYLNEPDLTAERFIAHSFDGETATHLYKTGDLARFLSDGNIEFLGRLDDQVKIRGYRIELGEIESVLMDHPDIQHAIAVAREDNPGDKRLVAYCVATEGHVLETNQAKQFLRTKLPEYMIPTAWVKIPSLPRLPNGKVDRASLPAAEKVKPEQLDAVSVAWTPLEKLLARVWAQLLPRAPFSIEDNFFDLGGHSLLATQVVARLGKMLNMEISLRFLFEAPTIQELAQRIVVHQETGLAAGESLYELKSLMGEETQTII